MQRAKNLRRTARARAQRRTSSSRRRGRWSGRSTSGTAPAIAASASARPLPRARSCFLVWRAATAPTAFSAPPRLIRRPSIGFKPPGRRQPCSCPGTWSEPPRTWNLRAQLRGSCPLPGDAGHKFCKSLQQDHEGRMGPPADRMYGCG